MYNMRHLGAGNNYVGAVAANGGFTFQGAGSSSGAVSGQYLSHTCNADGRQDLQFQRDCTLLEGDQSKPSVQHLPAQPRS